MSTPTTPNLIEEFIDFIEYLDDKERNSLRVKSPHYKKTPYANMLAIMRGLDTKEADHMIRVINNSHDTYGVESPDKNKTPFQISRSKLTAELMKVSPKILQLTGQSFADAIWDFTEHRIHKQFNENPVAEEAKGVADDIIQKLEARKEHHASRQSWDPLKLFNWKKMENKDKTIGELIKDINKIDMRYPERYKEKLLEILDKYNTDAKGSGSLGADTRAILDNSIKKLDKIRPEQRREGPGAPG